MISATTGLRIGFTSATVPVVRSQLSLVRSMHAASKQLRLTVLYDGGCGACDREITFLRRRDPEGLKINFIDIFDDKQRHLPADYGLTWEDAMREMHVIDETSGHITVGVDSFPLMYSAVGLGWLTSPLTSQWLKPLANAAYDFWAQWRFRALGRPELETLVKENDARLKQEKKQNGQ